MGLFVVDPLFGFFMVCILKSPSWYGVEGIGSDVMIQWNDGTGFLEFPNTTLVYPNVIKSGFVLAFGVLE